MELQPLIGRFHCLGAATVRGRLYDLGEYPGVVLDEFAGAVRGEVLELPDSFVGWSGLDAYEGYDRTDTLHSLFVRANCAAWLADGQARQCWIYIYNQPLRGAQLIASGDYAEVRQNSLRLTPFDAKF